MASELGCSDPLQRILLHGISFCVCFDARDERPSALQQCRRRCLQSTSRAQRHKTVAIRSVILCNACEDKSCCERSCKTQMRASVSPDS